MNRVFWLVRDCAIALICRWQPFWKMLGWIICQSRWRRRRTSSTCLDSAPDFTRFLQWRGRWNPWNTWRMGPVSCNIHLWDQMKLAIVFHLNVQYVVWINLNILVISLCFVQNTEFSCIWIEQLPMMEKTKIVLNIHLSLFEQWALI